jgi:hypothetical protein
MESPHESASSLSVRERTRLALLDNHEVRLGGAPQAEGTRRLDPAHSPTEESGNRPTEEGRPEVSYTDLIALRLRAIQHVRDMAPRRSCYGSWLEDLEQSLGQIPRHSVHYKPTVQRLLEAHEEWLDLEERLRSAHEIIRSTQWLVSLLADPHGNANPGAE